MRDELESHMLKKLPCICLSFVSMSLLDDCAPRTEWEPIYFPFFHVFTNWNCAFAHIHKHTHRNITLNISFEHIQSNSKSFFFKSLISWSKSVTSNIVCWWCMLFAVPFAVYYFFSPHFTSATFWFDKGKAIFILSIRGMVELFSWSIWNWSGYNLMCVCVECVVYLRKE